MTTTEFVDKIVVLWPGSYSEGYIDEIKGYISRFTEPSLEAMIRWLKQAVETSGRLVFSKIIKAGEAAGQVAKRGIGAKPDFERITCTCCGAGFEYNVGADSDCYMTHGVSAVCPRCGWPHWDAIQQERIGQLAPEATDRYLERREANRIEVERNKRPVFSQLDMRREHDRILEELAGKRGLKPSTIPSSQR